MGRVEHRPAWPKRLEVACKALMRALRRRRSPRGTPSSLIWNFRRKGSSSQCCCCWKPESAGQSSRRPQCLSGNFPDPGGPGGTLAGNRPALWSGHPPALSSRPLLRDWRKNGAVTTGRKSLGWQIYQDKENQLIRETNMHLNVCPVLTCEGSCNGKTQFSASHVFLLFTARTGTALVVTRLEVFPTPGKSVPDTS